MDLILSRKLFLLLAEKACLLFKSLKIFAPMDIKEFELMPTAKLPEIANLVFWSWIEFAFVKYEDKEGGGFLYLGPKAEQLFFGKWDLLFWEFLISLELDYSFPYILRML